MKKQSVYTLSLSVLLSTVCLTPISQALAAENNISLTATIQPQASKYNEPLLAQMIPNRLERAQVAEAMIKRNSEYFTTATQIAVILNSPQTENIGGINDFLSDQNNKSVIELSKAISEVVPLPHERMSRMGDTQKSLVTAIQDAAYPSKPTLKKLKLDLEKLKKALEEQRTLRKINNQHPSGSSSGPTGSGGLGSINDSGYLKDAQNKQANQAIQSSDQLSSPANNQPTLPNNIDTTPSSGSSSTIIPRPTIPTPNTTKTPTSTKTPTTGIKSGSTGTAGGGTSGGGSGGGGGGGSGTSGTITPTPVPTVPTTPTTPTPTTVGLIGQLLGCASASTCMQKVNVSTAAYNKALQDLNTGEKTFISNDSGATQKTATTSLDKLRSAYNQATKNLMGAQTKALAYFKAVKADEPNNTNAKHTITQLEKSSTDLIKQSIHTAGDPTSITSNDFHKFNGLNSVRLLNAALTNPALLKTSTFADFVPSSTTIKEQLQSAMTQTDTVIADITKLKTNMSSSINQLKQLKTRTPQQEADLIIKQASLDTINKQLSSYSAFKTSINNIRSNPELDNLVNQAKSLQYMRYAQNPWGKLNGLSTSLLNSQNPSSATAKMLALQHVDVANMSPRDLLVLRTYLGDNITRQLQSSVTGKRLLPKLDDINKDLYRYSISQAGAHDFNRIREKIQTMLNLTSPNHGSYTYDARQHNHRRNYFMYLRQLKSTINQVYGTNTNDRRGVRMSAITDLYENRQHNSVVTNTGAPKQLMTDLTSSLPSNLRSLTSGSSINWNYKNITDIKKAIASNNSLSQRFNTFVNDYMPGYSLRKTEINNINRMRDGIIALSRAVDNAPTSNPTQNDLDILNRAMETFNKSYSNLPNASHNSNPRQFYNHSFPFQLPGSYSSGNHPNSNISRDRTTQAMQALFSLTSSAASPNLLVSATTMTLGQSLGCQDAASNSCSSSITDRINTANQTYQNALTNLNTVSQNHVAGKATTKDLTAAQTQATAAATNLANLYKEGLSYFQSLNTAQGNSSTNPYQSQIQSLTSGMSQLASSQATLPTTAGNTTISTTLAMIKRLSQATNPNSIATNSDPITMTGAQLKTNLTNLSTQLSNQITNLSTKINSGQTNATSQAQNLIKINTRSFDQQRLNALNKLNRQVTTLANTSTATLDKTIKLSNSLQHLATAQNPWNALKALDSSITVPTSGHVSTQQMQFLDALNQASKAGKLNNLNSNDALAFRTYLGNGLDTHIQDASRTSAQEDQRQSMVNLLDNKILAGSVGNNNNIAKLRGATLGLASIYRNTRASNLNNPCSSTNQSACSWTAFNAEYGTVNTGINTAKSTLTNAINKINQSKVYTPKMGQQLFSQLQQTAGSSTLATNPSTLTVAEFSKINDSVKNSKNSNLINSFNNYLKQTDFNQRSMQLATLNNANQKLVDSQGKLQAVKDIFNRSFWGNPFAPIQYGVRSKSVSRNYVQVKNFFNSTPKVTASMNIPTTAQPITSPGDFNSAAVQQTLTNYKALSSPTKSPVSTTTLPSSNTSSSLPSTNRTNVISLPKPVDAQGSSSAGGLFNNKKTNIP